MNPIQLKSVPTINLGLPKGFNKVRKPRDLYKWTTNIVLYLEPTLEPFDRFNVPVWAMEKDGYLFVRQYSPRIDSTNVCVLKDGKIDLVPGAINVGEFIEEID